MSLIDGREIYNWFKAKLEHLTKFPLPALPANGKRKADWGKLFEVWFRETSPPLAGGTWVGRDRVVFGPTSPYTLDLAASPGMQKVKEAFCKAGKARPNPFPGNFAFVGRDTARENYYTLVEWFVGSFGGPVHWTDKGNGTFDIRMDAKNVSGWFSGTRLPQTWQDRIKSATGLAVKALYDGNAPRGQVTNQKVRALIRAAVDKLPVLDVPDWVPFVGKNVDPKTLVNVDALPSLPSFGGDFTQVYQVRTTWTCGS